MKTGLVIEECSVSVGKKEEMSIHKPFTSRTLGTGLVPWDMYCRIFTVCGACIVSMVDGGWSTVS